jgi:Tol biopolymer transport system component
MTPLPGSRRVRTAREQVRAWVALFATLTIVGCGSDRATGPGGNPGATILFTSARADSTWEQLYTMNLDGTGLQQLTTDSNNHERTAVSPDGRSVLFVQLGGNGPSGSFLMNIDGSSRRPSSVGFDPVWSPDGLRVVSGFVPTDCQCSVATLVLSNPDGTGRVDIAPDQNQSTHPTWSPDGTQLAYEKLRLDVASTRDIYVVNSDGSGTTAITDSTTWDRLPSWSPLGDHIAFVSDPTPEGWNLNLIDPDGGNRVGLPARCGDTEAPRWSPSAEQIICFRPPVSIPSWQELVVINTDGSGQKVLLQGPHLAFASWSADGDWVLFEGSCGGGSFDGCLIHPDGTGLTNVTHDSQAAYQPVWVH